jgi:alpha-tubulin suppressor-like RCC1 family protein
MTRRRDKKMCCTIAAFVLLFSAAPSTADHVYTWGYNSSGQLGNGTNDNSNLPVHITSLSGNVSAVSMGTGHSLAIRDGTVWAWGVGSNGQLGNGGNTNSSVPVPASVLTNNVTAISGGAEHSLAIQNGAAFAWGRNVTGALGNGTNISSNVPVPVSGLSNNVTAISATESFSLAIQNGAAWAWGWNAEGQLGNGTNSNSNVPVPVTGLSNGVTAVSGGYSHSLAVQNGAAFAWGFNGSNGLLGDGTSNDSNVPVPVSGLSAGVTRVSASETHSLALKDGNVFAWGMNFTGQLGTGTYDSGSNVPVKVLDLDVDIVDIATTFFSSYALSADGRLWVWGNNEFGQLGLGDNTNRTVPTQLFVSYVEFTSITEGSGRHAVVTFIPVPEPAIGLLTIVSVTMLFRAQRLSRKHR